MRTVVVRLPGEDFAAAVGGMRDWLQTNQCEPVGYRYDQNEDAVLVSVDFAVAAQAKAFATRFGTEPGIDEPLNLGHNGPSRYREQRRPTRRG